MSSLFTVDEPKLSAAFQIDLEKMQMDLSGLDFSGMDLSGSSIFRTSTCRA